MAEPDRLFVEKTLRARAEMALAKAQRHAAVQRLLEHPAFEPAKQLLSDPMVCAALVGAFIALLFFACAP